AVRLRIDPAKKSELQSADDRAAASKNKRVTDRPPKNRHQSRDAETLGEDRQHIFLPDEPAIKKSETGQRHEKHEGGSGHHPAVVAGTRPGNVRGSFRVRRIRTARGIVYISFEIGDPLIKRR